MRYKKERKKKRKTRKSIKSVDTQMLNQSKYIVMCEVIRATHNKPSLTMTSS